MDHTVVSHYYASILCVEVSAIGTMFLPHNGHHLLSSNSNSKRKEYSMRDANISHSLEKKLVLIMIENRWMDNQAIKRKYKRFLLFSC